MTLDKLAHELDAALVLDDLDLNTAARGYGEAIHRLPARLAGMKTWRGLQRPTPADPLRISKKPGGSYRPGFGFAG